MQELGRPYKLLIKGSLEAGHTVSETRRGNLETELCWSLNDRGELKAGRSTRPKGGRPKGYRESDTLIVLGGRESRPQGEVTMIPSHTRTNENLECYK
jgi:hypothetical protein